MLTPMLTYDFEIWAKKEGQNWKGFRLLHQVVHIFPNGVFCSALHLFTVCLCNLFYYLLYT
jgi:hypothetical protein